MEAAATRSANLLKVLLDETASAGYGGPATTLLTYAALNEEECETRARQAKRRASERGEETGRAATGRPGVR